MISNTLHPFGKPNDGRKCNKHAGLVEIGFSDFTAAFFWGAERTTHPTWQLGFEGSLLGTSYVSMKRATKKTQKRGLDVLGR